MVKWKKLNKTVAGVLLGVMVLFSASTTAFAYVDPSAETANTEAAQTEILQNREMGKSRMISRMDPVKNSLRSQQRITIPFIL